MSQTVLNLMETSVWFSLWLTAWGTRWDKNPNKSGPHVTKEYWYCLKTPEEWIEYFKVLSKDGKELCIGKIPPAAAESSLCPLEARKFPGVHGRDRELPWACHAESECSKFTDEEEEKDSWVSWVERKGSVTLVEDAELCTACCAKVKILKLPEKKLNVSRPFEKIT